MRKVSLSLMAVFAVNMACYSQEATSSEKTPSVVNLVQNAAFDKGMEGWECIPAGVASVSDGVCHISIGSSTNTGSHCLYSAGLDLRQGVTYTFSFDAKAEAAKAINIQIRNEKEKVGAWSPKLEIGTEMETVSFDFECTMASGYYTPFFYLGGDDSDLWIDNVSVTAR